MENPRRSRRLYGGTVQNFLVVWLDENINEKNNTDCQNTIIKLREVVNTVNTFTNMEECINFITDIKVEKVFMILSGALAQTTVSIIHDMTQVNTTYIFCENKARHEQWTKQWPKIKGIFTDIQSICEALKKAVHKCNQNTISMSFMPMNVDTTTKSLDQLDQSFMYTQVLKEILLTIDFQREHFQAFIAYCQEQFAGNSVQLHHVNKFENEYHRDRSIWWYTHECFLYCMLNRALQVMDVDLIIKLGFFLSDLHQHITRIHSEQYGKQTHSDIFTVYRGQGLSQTDFNQLLKTRGGLLSFNNFLSTSLDRTVSLAYAESNLDNPYLIGILFQITVNSLTLLTPFANVRDISYYQEEEEILFSMHSIFRIGEIKQINDNNRFWQVTLTLTGDHDPQLYTLTEQIRAETSPHEMGWKRLGQLLIKLGQFDKAQQVYDVLLVQASDHQERASIYHHLGTVKIGQGEYPEAIAYDEKSLEINQKSLPVDHPDLAASYSNIGLAYYEMSEYPKALSSHEKALKIRQKTLPLNHLDLATSYTNIGHVYFRMGKYPKALSSHGKALEIQEKILPLNHPDLATSYDRIGLVYDHMGEYSKAFSYYETALEIRQKSLPPDHPRLANSYNNIGLVYDQMGEYSKALSSHENALKVRRKSLPLNHPDSAASYNNIGSIYYELSEYSKAHSYHEKALEIQQKTLPPNHVSLATSYNNIGLSYSWMGEYSRALSYHKRAFEIRQKTLPPNHPDLAISYDPIGSVYFRMGKYSKAFSSYEKSLKIRQKALPLHHPDLAISYNDIGVVYTKMNEYSKALSYLEKAVEIRQKALCENHPDLAVSYSNIGRVYNEMDEYSKALLYHEKALEIKQKTLSSNDPSLAISHNDVGLVYSGMHEYSKAFLYYSQAVEIGQCSLPENHARLQEWKRNLENVKKKL
ncbi:unnamed protein product [Adineta steineri]|uniref:ADP ribosyltransferase domain-containing protein n=1 Tax=Adineta steineri TaxID=433720 RepID=A0A814LPX3_9BILA|nr:unnamed protein product [Adineta steineri]CAF3839504.1 unnamed protein product [Adineta steineri]